MSERVDSFHARAAWWSLRAPCLAIALELECWAPPAELTRLHAARVALRIPAKGQSLSSALAVHGSAMNGAVVARVLLLSASSARLPFAEGDTLRLEYAIDPWQLREALTIRSAEGALLLWSTRGADVESLNPPAEIPSCLDGDAGRVWAELWAVPAECVRSGRRLVTPGDAG